MHYAAKPDVWLSTRPTFYPNEWLNDNDTISVGNLTLEVLHCPGHTPGHVVLVERSSNRVIVGDVFSQLYWQN